MTSLGIFESGGCGMTSRDWRLRALTAGETSGSEEFKDRLGGASRTRTFVGGDAGPSEEWRGPGETLGSEEFKDPLCEASRTRTFVSADAGPFGRGGPEMRMRLAEEAAAGAAIGERRIADLRATRDGSTFAGGSESGSNRRTGPLGRGSDPEDGDGKTSGRPRTASGARGATTPVWATVGPGPGWVATAGTATERGPAVGTEEEGPPDAATVLTASGPRATGQTAGGPGEGEPGTNLGATAGESEARFDWPDEPEAFAGIEAIWSAGNRES